MITKDLAAGILKLNFYLKQDGVVSALEKSHRRGHLPIFQGGAAHSAAVGRSQNETLCALRALRFKAFLGTEGTEARLTRGELIARCKGFRRY